MKQTDMWNILYLVIGIILGIIIGMIIMYFMFSYSFEHFLSHSNGIITNMNINLNETKLVEGVTKFMINRGLI